MPFEYEIRKRPKKLPYAVIGDTGYGRMDPSTPAEGFAIVALETRIAVVCHCPQLQRTTLTCTNYGLNETLALRPIFNWTIALGELIYNEEHSLEVALIHGHMLNFQQNQFMQYDSNYSPFDINNLDILSTPRHMHRITFDGQKSVFGSSRGAMLVDKLTAKITILESPLAEFSCVIMFPSHYSVLLLRREVFSIDLFPSLFPTYQPKHARRHLQFDVDHYTLPSEMPDECRLAIRAKCSLNITDHELLGLLTRFGFEYNSIRFNRIKTCLEYFSATGLPCERCPDKATEICRYCRGAWYCSPLHQSDDWFTHRRFCSSYLITTSARISVD